MSGYGAHTIKSLPEGKISPMGKVPQGCEADLRGKRRMSANTASSVITCGDATFPRGEAEKLVYGVWGLDSPHAPVLSAIFTHYGKRGCRGESPRRARSAHPRPRDERGKGGRGIGYKADSNN